MAVLLRVSQKSTAVCSILVRQESLRDLLGVLPQDPNSILQGKCIYNQVFFATALLFNILIAENMRHLDALRSDPDILSGIFKNLIFFHYNNYDFIKNEIRRSFLASLPKISDPFPH